MKFAHEFEEALKRDDYPVHWVRTAISYRQLKKCIKKVQRELSGLGLDSDTLSHLWQSFDGRVRLGSSSSSPPFLYTFAGGLTTFRPKLVFLVDPNDGAPVDAALSPETREYLQNLTRNQRQTSPRITEVAGEPARAPSSEPHDVTQGRPPEVYHKVEVPLQSDSEFFQMLQQELSSLEALQAAERVQMTTDINTLAREIAKAANPLKTPKVSDLYAWRDIFEMYIESGIFFSTNEQDGGTRNSTVAQAQLQRFMNNLDVQESLKRLKRKQSRIALGQFLRINLDLLRNLKFQEINQTAMAKILKKFDKRTALGAKSIFPEMVATDSFLAQPIAKAVCFQLSRELLAIVPRLNDYLCPVCFSLAFKPIRLKCGHIFCIRCLIVMQRARDDHCPLCRESVVMQADSGNLDPALMNFLTKYFPKEVKEKQKSNERASGIDRYGEDYDRCVVM